MSPNSWEFTSCPQYFSLDINTCQSNFTKCTSVFLLKCRNGIKKYIQNSLGEKKVSSSKFIPLFSYAFYAFKKSHLSNMNSLNRYFFECLLHAEHWARKYNFITKLNQESGHLGFSSRFSTDWLSEVKWTSPSHVWLCDPMDCNLLSSSVHGFLQEYWSGYLVPSPGDLPDLGFEPESSALQADSLLCD